MKSILVSHGLILTNSNGWRPNCLRGFCRIPAARMGIRTLTGAQRALSGSLLSAKRQGWPKSGLQTTIAKTSFSERCRHFPPRHHERRK